MYVVVFCFSVICKKKCRFDGTDMYEFYRKIVIEPEAEGILQGSLESYRPSKKTYINAGRFAYDVFERFQNKLETSCDLGS